MSGQLPGLVLPVDAVSDLETTTFPGFPGTFTPGEPVALADLGFDSEDEAFALVEELQLPLEPAKAELSTPPATEEELAAARAEKLSALKVDDLKQLAPAGLELPTRKDEIVDALAAAGVEAPDEEEPAV